MRYKHTPIVVEKPENCVAVPIIDSKSTEGDNEKEGPAKKKSSLMALQTILIIHIMLGIPLILGVYFVSILR